MHISVRTCIALMFGILLSQSLPWLNLWCWIAGMGLLLLNYRMLANSRVSLQVMQWALWLCVGAAWGTWQGNGHRSFLSNWEEIDTQSTVKVRGVVESNPRYVVGGRYFSLGAKGGAIGVTLYEKRAEEVERERVEIKVGDEIEVKLRLRLIPPYRWRLKESSLQSLWGRGIALRGYGNYSELKIIGRGGGLLSKLYDLRHRLLEEMGIDSAQSLGKSEPGRGIVAALLTGERAGIDQELNSAMRATGISHVLAVSGMHLGALIAFSFLLIRWLWGMNPCFMRASSLSVAAGGAMLIALAFTLLTGAKPSTLRALLIAILYLSGILLRRRPQLLHSSAWAMTVLLLWNPFLLWDLGFQLSFAAAFSLAIAFGVMPTSGALVLSPQRGWLARIYLYGSQLFKASLVTSYATFPFVVSGFSEYSWIGVAHNLWAIPIVSLLLLPLSFAALPLLILWRDVGLLLLEVSYRIGDCVAYACQWGAAMVPIQHLEGLSVGEWFLWGIGAALILCKWENTRLRWLLLGLLAALTIFLNKEAKSDKYAGAMRVSFLDVGQGDAAVIELGEKVWIVDGGGRPFGIGDSEEERRRNQETPGRRALLPFLQSRQIEKVDLVVVSHPHPDHFLGLRTLLGKIPIVEIWSVGMPEGEESHMAEAVRNDYWQWLEEARRAGTIVRTPPLGLARKYRDASLYVLWPRYAGLGESSPRKARADPIFSANDNSIVLRLEFAGRKILFAGDLEEESEALLLKRVGAEELCSDIVKVGHHGSKTSSTIDFVRASCASVAVISCGVANPFFFPHSSVLKRWHSQVDWLFRTDLHGTVQVTLSENGAMDFVASEELASAESSSTAFSGADSPGL